MFSFQHISELFKNKSPLFFRPPPFYIQKMDPIKAPFNMAINTLERIGGILHDLHKTAMDSMLSPAQKQFILVSQTKHLFSQSTPLMEGDMIKELMPRVLKLAAVENTIQQTRSGVIKAVSSQLIYNKELDDEIMSIAIEIQTKLQSLGYFMPPRKDLGGIVGDFS